MKFFRFYVPSFLLVLSVSLLSSACAGYRYLNLDSHIAYQYPESSADIQIRYSQVDADSARMVGELTEQALEKISKWGRFTEKVTIRIHPDHASLEKAVHRKGYPWLRGWARYDTVDLQSPHTWGGHKLKMRIFMLLTHELTHVMMYQNGGSRHNWYRKDFPMWFREGMASLVAEQGAMRGSRETIRKYYENGMVAGDPVCDADKIVKDHQKLVYLVAHYMFEDLVKKFGPEKIMRIVYEVKAGRKFKEAWEVSLGSTLDEWEKSWPSSLLISLQS